MKVTRIERDGIHVLQCEGALSIGPAADAFETACKPWIGKGRGVVLDLSQVQFIDSTGVAAVVECAEVAKQRGALIKVVLRPGGAARKTFEITQLDQIFEAFEDVETALASFS